MTHPATPPTIRPDAVASMPRPRWSTNTLYRTILGVTRSILCLLTCRQLAITASATVYTERVIIRSSVSTAVSTVVTNLGPSKIALYERGVFIRTLDANASYAMPLGGRFFIEANVSSGSADVHVTTHKRCDCDDPEDNEDVAPAPVGTALL